MKTLKTSILFLFLSVSVVSYGQVRTQNDTATNNRQQLERSDRSIERSDDVRTQQQENSQLNDSEDPAPRTKSRTQSENNSGNQDNDVRKQRTNPNTQSNNTVTPAQRGTRSRTGNMNSTGTTPNVGE